MQDIHSMLASIKRPRLLIRAARLGTQDYARTRHLQRVLGYGRLPRPALAVLQLIELESALNEQRKADDAAYSLPRHLDVLIALMGEAQFLLANRSPGPM